MPSDPLLAHSQRIDREEMLAIVRLLERKCTMLEKAIDVLAAALSEVELRGLFVMDRMQMQIKDSSLIIPGQSQMRRRTMLELFEEQRGAFAQELMRREQAAEMAQAGQGTDDGENPQAAIEGTTTTSAPSVDDYDCARIDGGADPRFKRAFTLAKS